MTDLSLIVLTHNEELNLGHCLESVSGLAAEIFVVDSGSTDGTLDVARAYTRNIYVHDFQTQAQQFNWALETLPITSGWILRLDADEFLLPSLRDEIAQVIPQAPDDVSGYLMKRRVYFNGRWMRHGGYYPTWLLRLFRRGQAQSEPREMDEHIVLRRGRASKLRHDFVDCNRKGLAFWTEKHERFAAREARALIQQAEGQIQDELPGNLFGSQPARKRWLRTNCYTRSPLFARAFAYFGYRYFLRGGFLDGVDGLVFHFLQGCWYRFYIDAKVAEMGRPHTNQQVSVSTIEPSRHLLRAPSHLLRGSSQSFGEPT